MIPTNFNTIGQVLPIFSLLPNLNLKKSADFGNFTFVPFPKSLKLAIFATSGNLAISSYLPGILHKVFHIDKEEVSCQRKYKIDIFVRF